MEQRRDPADGHGLDHMWERLMRTDRHTPKKKQSGPRLDITNESRPGDLMVMLRVRGVIDVDNSRALDHYLRSGLPPESRYILLNLGEVTRLEQAGVRVLLEHARRLASTGRILLVIALTSDIRRILRSPGATGVLGVHHTVSSAIGSCRIVPRAPTALGRDTAERPGHCPEALDPRRMTRVLNTIEERYGIADAGTAFELLRDSAQHHSLKLSTLVSAFLTAEPPRQRGGADWATPGWRRIPAPALTFCLRDHGNDRAVVLSSFMDVVLGFMRTSTADLQLVDVVDGTLRLETRRGSAVASVSSAMALERKERVIAPIVADASLDQEFVDARFRVVQSTPLVEPGGRCVGVVSTYHTGPGHTPTKLQCAKLDYAATEIATWLEWHQQIVVVDALEHLHQLACQFPADTPGKPGQ
jgi:anti-anti-sigma factor